MAKQHVVSEWLLKEFAVSTPGGLVLTILDKRTGKFSMEPPSQFMVEVDAHSAAVEKELSRHESRAKRALMNLRSQMEKLPPGAYQLMKSASHGEEFEFVPSGPEGYVEGMGLIKSGVLNVADDRTIRDLGRYLAITYTRSPRMRRYGALYRAGVEAGIRRELRKKGVEAPADLDSIIKPEGQIEMQPLRIMATAEAMLVSMTWWAIKTQPDDRMIACDGPVVPTVALGHAIVRMHLGQKNALVIAMPLSPQIAVVATRMRMLTLSGSFSDFGQLVNASLWPYADRYVISSSEAHLREVESKLPGAKDIDDPSPHDEGARFGRSFARRQLIAAIRAKEGTASPRERHIIERKIGHKLPPNEIMAAAAKARRRGGKSGL
ncbi:MAG: hypothetical protein ABI725_01200 [Chloroflexota bacterium]